MSCGPDKTSFLNDHHILALPVSGEGAGAFFGNINDLYGIYTLLRAPKTKTDRSWGLIGF